MRKIASNKTNEQTKNDLLGKIIFRKGIKIPPISPERSSKNGIAFEMMKLMIMTPLVIPNHSALPLKVKSFT